ncbi:hypothetical protein [Clostridium massiliodielmoense]|uniref:hypothetical protein n=1 Tax=Clostridium massiliodielmoense TaxID=1776385 RepID=UPI001FA8B799|nr:hypothetical protein [Clostridium massiliodielmoense]
MGASSVDSGIDFPCECDIEIRYDRWGRMYYNQQFHFNNGKAWSREDLQYLINWYDIIGPEEMSFALGRTIKTVQAKASQLRKEEIMKKSANEVRHKRIKKSCANSSKLNDF